MSDLKYWVGFSCVPGIGRVRLALLERHFGDLSAAWDADGSELTRAGLDRRAVASILNRRPKISLDEEMERLERYGVQVLTWRDDAYPSLLKEIDDVPPVLYVRGSLTTQDRTALAVVGTRRATPYGKEAATRLSSDLAHSGVTIVSGLARGIDTTAHRATLDAGGRTIAVLASGVDVIYPSENASLAREIIQNGALVSEHPLGIRPEGSHFFRRNRIMSGLSLGVLIVEAGEGSGANITVKWALEQGREVFAVPGSIFSQASLWTNRWIQEGAKLVTVANDILQELNLASVTRQLEFTQMVPTSNLENQLLGCLSPQPVHIDLLCRQSGLPVATVSSTLTVLELKGAVRQVGSMQYVLA
ncbi:MAG: processing protein [Dehalococcoidia bacterium]|nr:processing protein [Dehalococcoidia bacterium]